MLCHMAFFKALYVVKQKIALSKESNIYMTSSNKKNNVLISKKLISI